MSTGPDLREPPQRLGSRPRRTRKPLRFRPPPAGKSRLEVELFTTRDPAAKPAAKLHLDYEVQPNAWKAWKAQRSVEDAAHPVEVAVSPHSNKIAYVATRGKEPSHDPV